MLWWIVAVAVLIARIGAIVLVAIGGWWLWWRFPRSQANRLSLDDPKERADVEDNFRKTIGQLIGGVAVLLAAGIAYYTTKQTLQASDDQSRRSLRASGDLLISEQVSKGFEDLGMAGDDKLMVRLGGIYALEGVMIASAQYRQPVLEALCAFVRHSTKSYTATVRLPLTSKRR